MIIEAIYSQPYGIQVPKVATENYTLPKAPRPILLELVRISLLEGIPDPEIT
jgi:hypothetical protein